MNISIKNILILFCFSWNGLLGQTIQFEKLTIKDGLSDNSVRDILQDSRGYLWFATLNGLNRYDGKVFKNYTAIPGDETSFKNSRIQRIIEDAEGYIWCITLDRKVSRVNPTTNKVLQIYPHFIEKEVPIDDFKLMPSGDLWLWGGSTCIQISYHPEQERPQTTIYNPKRYLPNEPINFIHEDALKNIWIGTQNGLVRLVQKESDKEIFNNYFEGQNITTFREVETGIWFGSKKNGLKKYHFKANTFQDLPPNISNSLSENFILHIEPIGDQRLLIGSATAIFDVDFTQDVIKKMTPKGLRNATTIYTDSHNNHWIAAESRGVYKYDSKQQQIEYFALNASARSFLGDADKQLFFEDSRGDFWVGIYGGGIFLYNADEHRFVSQAYSAEQPNQLSSNQILCLYEDHSKNLWVGTMHGGVNKLSLSNSVFSWLQPMSNPRSYFDNEVRAVTVDRKEQLWVGSKGGKIFCYDAKFKQLTTLPDDLPPAQKAQLDNISVYCLYFDKADNLWIGTKGKGVFVIQDILQQPIAKSEILHFDKKFATENTNGLDEVFAIQEDHKGQFWIGSHSSGLTLLKNPFTNPSFQIYTKENTQEKLVSNLIRYIFIDNSNNLWIGASNGISALAANQLAKPNKEFLPITNDKKELSSLSYNSVDYIFQASDQTIYVTTMGGGLNQLEAANWETGKFSWKFFDKSMGLTTNKVYGIAEDDQQNLWISSSRGLNKFNPATMAFENFFIEKNNGLNYFTESCATKLPSGELLFGHNQGLLRFNPQEIIKDTSQYPVVLSQMFVNGVAIDPKTSNLLEQSIEFEQAIELDHQQNSIQLDFSVLDFRQPEKIQFSYMLENYDKEWSTPLATKSALYQNLPSGNYTFWLKGTNSDGNAIKKPLKLAIDIAPPFYKSKSGYALLTLLALFIFGVAFNLYNRQIETRHQIEFSEKVNEKKLKYYTNISHEFKTPLTMILSPVEDILQHKKATPEIIDYARHIRKNATYLLELVEQILDFRKIREEKMPLAVAPINLAEFIKNIYYIFKPLAEKRDIDFLLFLSSQDIQGYIDTKILEKIMFNLLSNAFKHTPANKRIELMVETTSDGALQIMVKDEGSGIKKKDLPRLFERFYRSENSSGLGLFFVKELVLLHKGKIEVDSVWQIGTTFQIKIPIQKSAYSTIEIANLKPTLIPTQNAFNSKLAFENKIISDPKNLDKLLIIDDNEEIRNYVGNKFKSNYQILLATNGKEGVQLAIQETPDIIISDVMMPIMDGIEVTRELRKNFNTSHIPIILLTANSSNEKKFEGIELGADDYITKPFNFKYLQLKIDSLIQQRKQLRTHFQQAPELTADTLTRSDQDKIFIQKVTEIINENLGTNSFSVELLAQKMNCSRTNFYKKMKGVTGETPHEFIRTIQMKKAALLLKETNHSVANIGYMVGYNDSNYFSKSFKKHFGKTPKAYQKEILKTEINTNPPIN
ncbi:MAG: two-component regulator propeller domain-containing protein [Saprospiraceae bacterium]